MTVQRGLRKPRGRLTADRGPPRRTCGSNAGVTCPRSPGQQAAGPGFRPASSSFKMSGFYSSRPRHTRFRGTAALGAGGKGVLPRGSARARPAPPARGCRCPWRGAGVCSPGSRCRLPAGPSQSSSHRSSPPARGSVSCTCPFRLSTGSTGSAPRPGNGRPARRRRGTRPIGSSSRRSQVTPRRPLPSPCVSSTASGPLLDPDPWVFQSIPS